MDLPGIGAWDSARLLVEVGDVTRFPDKAYFRVLDRTAAIGRVLRGARTTPAVVGREPSDQRTCPSCREEDESAHDSTCVILGGMLRPVPLLNRRLITHLMGRGLSGEAVD